MNSCFNIKKGGEYMGSELCKWYYLDIDIENEIFKFKFKIETKSNMSIIFDEKRYEISIKRNNITERNIVIYRSEDIEVGKDTIMYRKKYVDCFSIFLKFTKGGKLSPVSCLYIQCKNNEKSVETQSKKYALHFNTIRTD